MKTAALLLMLSLIGLSDAARAQQRKTIEYFVAPGGNGNNPGTIAKPFANPQQAWEAINGNKEPTDLMIVIRAGNYDFSKSLVLSTNGQDTDRHISFSAYQQEKVRFTGAIRLDNAGLALVTDPQTLARVAPEARGKIYQINLKAAGITDYGKMIPHGYKNITPAPLELFYNGSPLTIARWPNDRMEPVGTVLDPGPNTRMGERPDRGAVFSFHDERMNLWGTADNAWIGGIFSFGYADDYLKIDSFDLANKNIRLKQPAVYRVFSTDEAGDGMLKNARVVRGFFVYNLLEELDTPGEYYLDRKTGLLYFWPPDKLPATAHIEISMLQDPIVTISNTDHITFKGIEFASSRGIGLLAENTRHTRIIHCQFEGLGTIGISARTKNTDMLIQSCLIKNTGTGGIILGGGDQQQLIAANNRVDHCEIANYSRINRTYCPAVTLEGVGNGVSHCFIHDAPDQAIMYSGSNHTITFNHIKKVVGQMTDAGAIYTEKNPEARGTSISDNFFDSIGVDSHASIASVYFDAGAGGATIDDNVFFKAGSIGEYGFGAIHINGGTNNTFAGNYFIQCDKAFSFTRWGNPTTPALNTSDNTLVWQVNTFSTGGGYVHKNTVTVTRDPGFEDAAHGNFMLKKAPEALEQAADWKPIPFNKIGIIEK